MKVQFLARDVPASSGTVSRRADVVQRLDGLGHIDATAGEVNTTEKQWIARIGGTDLPVLDWSVQKLDDGMMAVSLVAVVDAVSAGDPGLADDAASDVTDELARAAERQQMVVDRLEFAQRHHEHTPEKLSAQVAGHAAGRLA
jgi:hypothetical protein